MEVAGERVSGIYETILAETGDPELARRLARVLHPMPGLNPAQALAYQWLLANDPRKYTAREIADQIGASSGQQAISLFGTLVHKGYCVPTREEGP